MTKQDMNEDNTVPLSRSLWRMYLQVGFIGLLVAVTLWYAMSTGSRVAKQYSPLVDAAMEVKLEITTAHLWLEEIISGDQYVDISEVWYHIDQAERYAQAMLEGGQNDEGTYLPLDDPEHRQDLLGVLEKIRDFRAIAEERLAHSDESPIGSDIDQHFDDVFNGLIDQVDDVETDLQQIMGRDILRSQSIQLVLLVLCIILTGIVGAILHRFLRRQSINLAMLKATNQQLTASEQQLKVANQQLTASEQQLKAANQQLTASEQQLRAINLQLRQSQQKLALHVQQTPLGVIQWDLDFKVTEWNSAAEKIFGFTYKEAIGQHAAGLIIPEPAKEVVNKVWRDLLAQKGGTRNTNENVTKNNGTIICEWYNTPLIDDNGEVVGVASLVLDITERKRAEEALRDSRDFFEGTLDGLLSMVGVLEPDGKMIFANKTALTAAGVSLEDMTGKPFEETHWMNHSEESIRVTRDAVRRCAAGETLTFQTRLKIANNKLIWADFRIHPVLDERGKVIYLIPEGTDITETKRLQALESRAERLETAGTIAGQVAHDFNNLLAPLMAYPDFIRDELPRNHPSLQYLDQIEKAAQKIADINQDLLAMGRRGHYNQVVLNINTVVQHAFSELKPYPNTLACELDLSDDLMDILGGGAQLYRMISNLLYNAKDAIQDIGQITVRTENYYVDDVSVVYGRVPKGEYVKLTISDTGCGIPDDIVQKIFDPFFTTKATDKKRGSGLGMSVVDSVIKDHNGYIDLSTKVGKGTSFYIYFPITRESMDGRDSVETCGGNELILVIDDDVVQREVSTQLLKKLGYKVNSVESGEKAIEYLQENAQDLVIVDMVMPGGIDGAETYRHILEISPHQKAIILSGFSESDRVLEAQKLGAGAFVRKPVTKKSIANAVRTELDR